MKKLPRNCVDHQMHVSAPLPSYDVAQLARLADAKKSSNRQASTYRDWEGPSATSLYTNAH